MTKIKNTLSRGIINKDLDERITPSDMLIDAENFVVTTSDNSGAGVGKNVPGNIKKTNYNISGAKTIGKGTNPSQEKVYNFVKGTNHDYIIEYNVETNTSEIVLQATTGGVLNFKSGERITNVDIISSGEDGGDLIAWSGDSNPPRIVNIERAKTWAVDGFTEDQISVMKPAPVFAPVITLQSTINTELTNFLEDKFLQFAYRYKYEDGYYSAISSWSQVAFLPSSFALDYQTYENLGMVNLANTVNISFNCGDINVIGIDLLFKESESSTVYIIDKLIKIEEGWNIPNQSITYNFYGNKIYGVLEESQYFRNFDNVPLKAKAQSVIGNRLVYGNITEGRDISEPVKLNVDYSSSSLVIDEKEGIVSDVIKETTYSNVVDFEWGTEEGGSTPVDEMDYETNTIIIDRTTDFPSATNIDLRLKVSPKGIYFGSTYSVYVKDGSTTLFSTTGLSGEENITYTMAISSGTIYNLKLYVVSDDGMIYDLDLEYNAYFSISMFAKMYISKYKYYAYDQLCYPKDGGYDSTLVGDTVIDYSASFDFTNFEFIAGTQMRFDFELQSSLVYEVQPEFTYFYNLTDSYTDLNDFMTNSGFVLDFEGVFSTSFYSGANIKASNAGNFVNAVPFKATYSGNILTITSIYVQYLVTEDSTWEENKDDFYLIKSLNFGLYSEDAFASMHSNRNYTCDIIYLDDKGRKTTVISGGETSVYIPASESERVNSLRVTTVSNPPSWAKYYKFAIKETKREYDTIYGNVVYEDGIYRWIQLVGENKNKIKEGDVLELKSDYSGPTEIPIQIKVLEVATQSKDFLPDNETVGGDPIIEDSGLYFKIKQGAFDINIDGDTFVKYEGFLKRRYAKGDKVYTKPLFGSYDETNPSNFIPTPVKNGSQIRFFARMYMFKNGAFDQQVEIVKFAEDDYDSIREWWEAEIADNQAWLNFAEDRLQDYGWDDEKRFYIASNRNGTQRSDVRVNIVFDVKFSSGTLIFENYKEEQLNAPYFESVETYNVVGGNHFSGNALAPNVHILKKTFNCFTFGNGCESNTIKDSFNGKRFYINSNPTSITEDIYRQVNRYADLTYSGVFNANSNVNRLNEFNLSLANYKDDIEKAYGPIMKIKGQDTNLEVFQEDKCSVVFYGKDLLYNADGTSNLSRIEDVLGQQKTYVGEYGISFHPDSFDDYASNSYFTDVKRGVVMRKNDSNGLQEISFYGMRDYFKKLFRDNVVNHINGKYDQFYDYYILNIQYNDTQYVTWIYSDKDNGWMSRLTFNPEDMIRINNHFVSFKNGEIYLHNQNNIFNTFYGVESPSKFSFNFSQDPSSRKNFRAISQEGTDAWGVTLNTDLDSGYINKVDFEKKEGVFYAYIRNSNENIDSSLLSCQGIGIGTVSGLTLNFSFELESVISVGDQIRNANLELVGTIVSKTSNSLTLNTMNNIGATDFVLCSKPQSIENQSMLGYYMKATLELTKNTYAEIFAVNCEVAKSYE